jgi:glycerol-3-phosphate dehydrogenase
MSAAQQPARNDLVRTLVEASAWDLVVIGGGATGLGVALDAAARGLSVALVEAEDFAKGTSSRATSPSRCPSCCPSTARAAAGSTGGSTAAD